MMLEKSRIKRQGLPHAIHITTENVTDKAGALKAFENSSDSLSAVINVLGNSQIIKYPFQKCPE